MTTPNDGGPAFPRWDRPDYLDGPTRSGMSLRDYFAAAVIQQSLSMTQTHNRLQECYDFDLAARCAYDVADAMLRAREGK